MSRKILNLSNGAYVQASESYCLFIQTDGKVQLKTRPIKYFEQILEDSGWCRIHRSYFVNPTFCNKISEDQHSICLRNGKELPISRRKRKYVLGRFNS
ncbi:MAG: LytTR family DNA-binding domain-containing protein [Bacteroidota bacterium]